MGEIEVLRVPLVNANEDEVVVRQLLVGEGHRVRAGEVVCVVESTKAAVEVEAPADGFVRRLSVTVDQRVAVGSLICAIAPSADAPVDLPSAPSPAVGRGDVRATRRAQEMADEHGLDLADLGLDRIVREADVAEFLRRSVPAKTAPPARPAADADGVGAREPGARMPRVVVWGAGGHARALVDLVREGYRDLYIMGALDDSPDPPSDVLGVPLIGDATRLADLRERGIEAAVLGIGAVTRNATRISCFERLLEVGFRVPNLIHPRAVVERSVRMGSGNQIFAGAIVGSNVQLGDNTIINSGVVLSHDCTIGSHSHITPGAVLAGGVRVGENTVIGMGVTVYLGVRIGSNVLISNGVHVMRDVPDGVVLRSNGRETGLA